MSQLEKTNAEIARIDARDRTDASFARLYQAHARQLAETVDALEAERDELRRRLDAVVAMLKEEAGNEPVSYTYPEDPQLLRWQTVSDLHARAVAIAEGRTE